MRDGQLQRENDRRAALGIEPLASADELEATEPPDILLEQATAVVADMVDIEAPIGQATTARADMPAVQ